MTQQSSQSPVKKARNTNSITLSSQNGQEIEYMPGELPADFHRKVVDLEIKIEMHGVSHTNQQDNEGQQIKLLSDLMQLYSVSLTHLYSHLILNKCTPITQAPSRNRQDYKSNSKRKRIEYFS